MNITTIEKKLDELFANAIDVGDETIWYSPIETLRDAILSMLEDEVSE